MDTDKLITYQTFDNYLSAELLKGLLESYDVPAYIIDENILYTFPAVNGIKLQIRAGDVEKADEIMRASAANEDELKKD